MKITNKLKYIGLAMLTLFVSACDNGFDEINTDPNSPVAVPASTLVTNGIFNVGYTYWDRDLNFEFGELMVQHMAQNEYTEEQRYSFATSDFNFRWGNLYSGQNVAAPTGGLYDLAAARNLVLENVNLSDAQRANQLAVIDIYMSFGYQMITDMWGDIPYSQAFQPSEYPFPAYDAQSDVYAGMISAVTDAVNSINTSETGFTSGDILFGGDMAQWEAFGNALLIRMGMRVGNSAAVAAGFGGTLPTSDMMLVFSESQDVSNPFYQDKVVSSRDDFRISAELVAAMNAQSDPRLTAYAMPAPGTDVIVGMPYGLSDGDAFTLKNSTSDIHTNIEDDPTAPAYLFTMAELEFFRAEAIVRGYITGNDAAAFAAAIDHSVAQWGVSSPGYGASIAYGSTNAEKLDAIALQKWIALYTNGVEAYAEWRRLDHPALTPSANAVSGVTGIPTRMLYPNTEDGTNGENLAAANGGSNSLNDRVGWDAN
ncbi:MAG: SusD/RagB family nutrient-binding outer membrane lipoprotein [Reichenbachiella sp.]|uniref:SusD/RagB family nutrient-binding outer membrane lipoprotein n=1 Tax=Reichenbachiella sp. TaxID=2184521 RepID=UPI00329A25CD